MSSAISPEEKGNEKHDKKPKPAKKRKTSRKVSAAKPVTKTGSQRELWTFPRHSLEEAIKVPQAIEEKHAGNPMDAEELPPLVGFRKVSDWRYQQLVRSANQYDLVDGSGTTGKVSITEIGSDIVAPSSPIERQQALIEAVKKVELFEKVLIFYKGKQIPEDEFFANTLVREFKVPRERVDTFIRVFIENGEFLKAFEADERGKKDIVSLTLSDSQASKRESVIDQGRIPTRKHLDTCFLLMPFGGWFDKYYNAIYSPAVSDAGFEPVRADDLFSSGMVVKQVWDQIKKAKVLLAELTDKNPNVFYELGLAHAIGRPVVIVTANMDDVPFDLRHLRVIKYDNREPDWSEKLKRDITTYLKNTKAEPSGSIPQTFHKVVEEE
jgi:hypothetical protein